MVTKIPENTESRIATDDRALSDLAQNLVTPESIFLDAIKASYVVRYHTNSRHGYLNYVNIPKPVETAKDFADVIADILFLRARLAATRMNQQKKAIGIRLRDYQLTYGDAISKLDHINRILEAGYSPSAPPDQWYIGLAVRPSQQSKNVHLGMPYRVFSQVIPQKVEDKYRAAEESVLFGTIIIASPRKEDFMEFPLSYRCPIMYGVIAAHTERKLEMVPAHIGNYERGSLRNAICFEIAIWDLGKDIEELNRHTSK